MIKKDPIDLLLEKTDKLIALTTQLIEQGREPMRKLVVRDDSVKPRRTYTRKAPTEQKKRSYKRGVNMPQETYEAIRNLAVGEKISMTGWMRANNVSYQALKDRMYSFMWKVRKEGDNKRFVVVRDSWEVFVQRTA